MIILSKVTAHTGFDVHIADKTIGFIEVKIICHCPVGKIIKYQQFVLAVIAVLDPTLSSTQ